MDIQNTEAEIRAAFAQQAVWCEKLGSPLTALVVQVLGENLDRTTKSGRRVLDWTGQVDALGDSVPLRFAGALNALVRQGRLPELARYYPPNKLSDKAVFAAAIIAAIKNADDEIYGWLDYAPQTNEVARAAVLYAGMSVIAGEFNLPLSIFEVGASAGLNLLMDQFSYDLGGTSLGISGSKVMLNPDWDGTPAPTQEPEIVARRGCDLGPLDMMDGEHQNRLLAYIWPDQPQRLARVNSAIKIAQEMMPQIDAMDAADWVEQRFTQTPQQGVVRVLYHSIAFQYFPEDVQNRITTHMSAVGALATPDAPLAWLSFENTGEGGPRLRLQIWPDGQKRLLANADAHVHSVHWLN